MTAKEYLKQIQNIHTKIENKKERLERIGDLLTSPAVGELNQDKVMSSIRLDKQEHLIVEQVDLEEELQHLMYEEAVLMFKIGRQIDEMEDPLHARILHLRYEENKTFQQIGELMNYSYSYIVERHGYALQEFRNKYLQENV